jgi:hypothetical protein
MQDAIEHRHREHTFAETIRHPRPHATERELTTDECDCETERRRQAEERDRDEREHTDEKAKAALVRVVDQLAERNAFAARSITVSVRRARAKLAQHLVETQPRRDFRGDRRAGAVGVHGDSSLRFIAVSGQILWDSWAMQKAEHAHEESQEQELEREEKTPSAGKSKADSATASTSSAAPKSLPGSPVAVGAWQPDDALMNAMGLGKAPKAKSDAPAAVATAPQAPASSASAPAGGGDGSAMRAMGLGGPAAPGAAGPGGGGKEIEGVHKPPAGKPAGIRTPDVVKKLDLKPKADGSNKATAVPMAKPGAAGPAMGAAPAGGGASANASATASGGGGSSAMGAASAGASSAGAATAPGTNTAPGGPGGDALKPEDPAAASASAAGGANSAIGESTVEAMIHTLLNDRDASARLRAAEALGKVQGRAAKTALEKAAKDPDPRVAAAATASLRTVG